MAAIHSRNGVQRVFEPDQDRPHETGEVKFFNRTKGWGFITADTDGVEVFVHYSAIEGEGYRNLFEGDRVSFLRVDRGRGPQAQAVATLRG